MKRQVVEVAGRKAFLVYELVAFDDSDRCMYDTREFLIQFADDNQVHSVEASLVDYLYSGGSYLRE